MPSVLVTLLSHHNLLLVALAAVVCGFSTFAGITLLHHARRTEGPMQLAWIGVAAVSVGFGIWSTHFIGEMAFDFGIPTGYNIPLTLFSLVIAMSIVGGALWYATLAHRRSDAALAGAIVGIGIAAMHYVGMQALIVGGKMGWDPYLVAISLLIGIGFGALALYVGTLSQRLGYRLAGGALLAFAIVAMHFVGMSAADLSNCYAVVGAGDQTPAWLSLVIALVSILILLFALGGIYLDLRDRRRNAVEQSRMRGLADAAVEGLLVCKDQIIVTANRSFMSLVDVPQSLIAGRHLLDFFDAPVVTDLLTHPNTAVETDLIAGDGRKLPVEVILREVDFSGTPHQAIAVRDLSARRTAEEHIRFLAHHDALTGLPNRASFARRLEKEIAHATRASQKLAVLALDLDRFKEVNDLFGHPAGDALLQRVGQALLSAVEGKGVAARLGGDEFAILAQNIDAADAMRLADGVFEAFRLANEQAPSGAVIAASIGIAIYPDHAVDAEQLVSHADTALYSAKQNGRGVCRMYENDMGAQVRDRRLLEHDLRHAIARNQLRLVYQPQVDIQTGEVTGFEALVRWAHPERGNVSPADFVPVAEESGLILQIGEWVLRTACGEAARWVGNLTVAVNVSAVQIHSPAFSHTLHEILLETGLKPSRLEVEITETALIRDMVRAVTTLRQIKALGVEIAMDDFGTGYSSLANLRAFPFSKIKVDQSFIRSVDQNEQSAAIVRAVLGLGAGLNVPVVAEGVERVEELSFLKGEICQSAQGYLLSRPHDISQFADIVEGRATRLDEPLIELRQAG